MGTLPNKNQQECILVTVIVHKGFSSKNYIWCVGLIFFLPPFLQIKLHLPMYFGHSPHLNRIMPPPPFKLCRTQVKLPLAGLTNSVWAVFSPPPPDQPYWQVHCWFKVFKMFYICHDIRLPLLAITCTIQVNNASISTLNTMLKVPQFSTSISWYLFSIL